MNKTCLRTFYSFMDIDGKILKYKYKLVITIILIETLLFGFYFFINRLCTYSLIGLLYR